MNWICTTLTHNSSNFLPNVDNLKLVVDLL